MSVIEAFIGTTCKRNEEVVAEWENKVFEGCHLTQFEHTAEAIQVMEAMEDLIVSLIYAHLLDSITLVLGSVEVRFFIRYDANPQEQDQLDISALELVRNPPAECQFHFGINDSARAEFLGVAALEGFSTDHVKVTS